MTNTDLITQLRKELDTIDREIVRTIRVAGMFAAQDLRVRRSEVAARLEVALNS